MNDASLNASTKQSTDHKEKGKVLAFLHKDQRVTSKCYMDFYLPPSK